MIINSPFKDYYDYLSHVYGQDTKIVYNRKNIIIDNNPNTNSIEIPIHLDCQLPFKYAAGHMYNYALLCVNGTRYLTLQMNYNHKQYNPLKYKEYKYHIIDKDLHSDIYDTIVETKISKQERKFNHMFGIAQKMYTYWVGKYDPKLVEISKIIKHPVFLITSVHNRQVTISTKVPVLSDTGIASMINAPQMYQELCYFMSNVMVDTPDTQPPVQIANNDLIVSKGFDIKQSFRHRK